MTVVVRRPASAGSCRLADGRRRHQQWKRGRARRSHAGEGEPRQIHAVDDESKSDPNVKTYRFLNDEDVDQFKKLSPISRCRRDPAPEGLPTSFRVNAKSLQLTRRSAPVQNVLASIRSRRGKGGEDAPKRHQVDTLGVLVLAGVLRIASSLFLIVNTIRSRRRPAA